MTTRLNLLNFNRAGLEEFFMSRGESRYRATQVMKWIYHLGVADFQRMTNLSKALRQHLAETVCIDPPEVVSEQLSEDGTCKWSLRVGGGNCVETVFIPEPDRGTLCVSSQVGCPLDCQFCATAKQGFNRNLTSAEIIGQVWQAAQRLGHVSGERVITNIVMMGMGEPLLNFDNVVRAMAVMLDDFGYGLSRRRVTLSTAGIVPRIDRLAAESQVSLAVSLHAPNDQLRDLLVPINRKYPLAQLLDACRRFAARDSHSHVTFEYVMLNGINDSQAYAQELTQVLKNIPCKINLIPFNPFPGVEYQCSSTHVIDAFRDTLHRAGFTAVTRKTRGADIEAACGQLVGLVTPKSGKRRRQREALV
jgi:23S rRNA (adenine2503-C2)-methyltransferase